jgi:hypothetical protein
LSDLSVVLGSGHPDMESVGSFSAGPFDLQVRNAFLPSAKGEGCRDSRFMLLQDGCPYERTS